MLRHVYALTFILLFSPLEASTAEVDYSYSFQNPAGEQRWVEHVIVSPCCGTATTFLKMNEVCDNDCVTCGYNCRNTFNHSCGADAAVNVLRWYGVDELAIDERFEGIIPYESNIIPIYRSFESVLFDELLTNNWTVHQCVDDADRWWSFLLPGVVEKKILTSVFGQEPRKGTYTKALIRTLEEYVDNYLPANYGVYTYTLNPGYGQMYIPYMLSKGVPVIVPVLTGNTGHFQTIIGWETIAQFGKDVDIVYFANGRDYASSNIYSQDYGEFLKLWKRTTWKGSDIPDNIMKEIIGVCGEKFYQVVVIWNDDIDPPEEAIGVIQGGGSNKPPIRYNLR